MAEKSGENFIQKRYPDLQKSSGVDGAFRREENLIGIKIPNSPDKRLETFFKTMEKVFITDPNHPSSETAEETALRRREMFKERFLYPAVLIDRDNVPDSYFALQIKIARERGQAGDLAYQGIEKVSDIPQSERIKSGETIYKDQKKSLDVWFDYMLGQDATYPAWFKYYALKSVTGLGNYDKEKKQFRKRTKDTTGIFPDLNREALAFVYDVVVQKHLKGLKQGEPDFQRIVDSANFGMIYSYAIDKVTPASKENKEKTEGEWVKFDQGSDPTSLYESLQGYGTGWCTAGEETARSQLQGGDFYVYYTNDEKGRNVIPRIAIRMERNQVAEVRGINDYQNLEDSMQDIAREKYESLPGGGKFEKRSRDMKMITLLDKKTQDGQELTVDELKFIYEFDKPIDGFGYRKDPRIEEILSRLDLIKFYSVLEQTNEGFKLVDLMGERFGDYLIENNDYKSKVLKFLVWSGPDRPEFVDMVAEALRDGLFDGDDRAVNSALKNIIENGNDWSARDLSSVAIRLLSGVNFEKAVDFISREGGSDSSDLWTRSIIDGSLTSEKLEKFLSFIYNRENIFNESSFVRDTIMSQIGGEYFHNFGNDHTMPDSVKNFLLKKGNENAAIAVAKVMTLDGFDPNILNFVLKRGGRNATVEILNRLRSFGSERDFEDILNLVFKRGDRASVLNFVNSVKKDPMFGVQKYLILGDVAEKFGIKIS